MTDEQLRDEFLREKGALQIPPAFTFESVKMEGYYIDDGGRIKHVANKSMCKSGNAQQRVNNWTNDRMRQRVSEMPRRKTP